jgi:hypothetical protein
VTEHYVEWRRCSCGTETGGAFPPEATAPPVWGPRVRASALYLMNRQLVPVERTAEIMSDLLGAPVSTGFLAGLAKTAVMAYRSCKSWSAWTTMVARRSDQGGPGHEKGTAVGACA